MIKLLLMTSLALSPSLYAAEIMDIENSNKIRVVSEADCTQEVLRILNEADLSSESINCAAEQINDYLTEHKVKNLDLSRKIEENTASVEIIAKVLEINETLIHIDLSDNRILADDAKILAKALEKNKTIESFDFALNRAGDVGLKAFATLLTSNKTLKKLDLMSNYITDEGAEHLISVLENDPALTVNLQFNFITNRARSLKIVECLAG